MIKRMGLLVFLSAATVCAAPKPEQLRASTLKHVRAGTQDEGIEQFTGYLSKQLNATKRIPTRELAPMTAAAECVRFMRFSKEAKLKPEMAAWILGSGERLHRIINIFQPEDNLPRCIEILEELRQHDPAGADEFFELMLAIAIVFDSPGSPRIHGQMGSDIPEYKPNVVERYDDYKLLYGKRRSKIEYRKLTASELRFVIRVPVPKSELDWARDNVGGSLSSWGGKYSSIEYDHDRPDAQRYSWDHGLYTLESIEDLGGICVDQAYYSVVTARAHGIPAIYFSGSGKSANHAWFAYMKGPGDWKLDIGRYSNDGYTTGYAIDPQTGKEMTDHDVSYACESSLHSAAFMRAHAYGSIAEVLVESDPNNALRCARLARSEVKRYLGPWAIELKVLSDRGDYDGLLDLFEDKGDAFRKYPDILVAFSKEIEAVFKAAGRTEEITKLMRSLASDMDDDRDDLVRSVEIDRIDRLVEAGEPKKARREMERLLDDQKEGGNKAFPLVVQYLSLTKKIGHTKEAVKFLEGYIDDLIEYNDFFVGSKKQALGLLRVAHENNNDSRNAAKVLERINDVKAVARDHG